MKIRQLQKEIYETAKTKGWHDPTNEKSFGECVVLVHAELSEAVEEYRKNYGYNKIYYKQNKPEGIPVELADAVIRILDMCEQFGIDLEEAIKIKNEYNKTRSWRHGNKVI